MSLCDIKGMFACKRALSKAVFNVGFQGAALAVKVVDISRTVNALDRQRESVKIVYSIL